MFHVPNKYRVTKGLLGSTDAMGNSGAFDIPISKEIRAFAIASNAYGWEHVSVHVIEDDKSETPAWEEMCFIKDLFWDKDDCVIQFHPPESEYVNNHKNVLHLWRPIGVSIPMPPAIMVGIKEKK